MSPTSLPKGHPILTTNPPNPKPTPILLISNPNTRAVISEAKFDLPFAQFRAQRRSRLYRPGYAHPAAAIFARSPSPNLKKE
eukprot:1358995-Amorphochlora_amoeboformis.AAC.2